MGEFTKLKTEKMFQEHIDLVLGGVKEGYTQKDLNESKDQINRFLRMELVVRARTLRKKEN